MFSPCTRTTARAVALALLVSGFGACADADDPQAPAVPESPQHVVADFSGGHFSFLTPLGDGAKAGVFNPRLRPVVEICRLATGGQPTTTSSCASIVAWFAVDGGSDGNRVSVDTRKEMYSVVWNLGRYALPTGYYRVFVRTARAGAAHFDFAYADLAVAPSRNEARALAGPGVHALTATSDLPIKFRIEEGALCGDSPDCFEGAVGPAGGVFVTNTEFAGVDFPAGALTSTRTLIIERLTAEDVPYCLPTRYPQYEGCYRYRLEPALAPGETFAIEATVGVCLDPAAVPFEDQLVLQKWDEVNPASLTSLPRREIEFLECADFSLAALEAHGTFATLASAGGRLIASIASAFLPQPLLAGTKSPYGGGLNDFSRIGWVRPLTLFPSAGTGQSACAGTALPVDPTFGVKSTLTDDDVAGVPLRFGVAGGSVWPEQATTDGNGRGGTRWTLGAAGTATLSATAFNPLTGFPQWTGGTPAYWMGNRMTATSVSCVD